VDSILNLAPHLAHLAFLPRWLSSTLNVALQPGQVVLNVTILAPFEIGTWPIHGPSSLETKGTGAGGFWGLGGRSLRTGKADPPMLAAAGPQHNRPAVVRTNYPAPRRAEILSPIEGSSA
jgi:hypothetical protein